MKIIKRLAVILVGLIALFLLVSAFLPSQVHVERSTTVKAPVTTVFGLVNGFERWNDWSPWAARDPQTKYEFAGPKMGVGSTMRWQSDHPEVGSGSQKIVESDAPRFVKSELDFGGNGKANATFTLSEENGATKVTWGLDSDLSWPVARWFGLAFDSMVGPDYEKGLAALKQLAESGPAKMAQPTPGAATQN